MYLIKLAGKTNTDYKKRLAGKMNKLILPASRFLEDEHHNIHKPQT